MRPVSFHTDTLVNNSSEAHSLAAIDLGSNSFHMIVGRLKNGQLQLIDRLREPVRLAAGLTDDHRLKPEVAQRALDCLKRFGQRISGLQPDNVRAVGTNTLRLAQSRNGFLDQAQDALGHSIEVISGIEEARLVHLGVAHSLAEPGGRRLVVGGGAVGTRKVVTLLDCGANVTVISPVVSDQLRDFAISGLIKLWERSYQSGDLDGMFLVIGATDDEGLNRQISSDANHLNTLCNIADRPEVCNFILPAIVERDDLIITISTSGKSPALAKKLRKRLEYQFGKEYGVFLKLMGAARKKLLSQAHQP